MFQELCWRIAGDIPERINLIMERLAKSFDRRIPAVHFRDGIELYARDLDDPIKKVN